MCISPYLYHSKAMPLYIHYKCLPKRYIISTVYYHRFGEREKTFLQMRKITIISFFSFSVCSVFDC